MIDTNRIPGLGNNQRTPPVTGTNTQFQQTADAYSGTGTSGATTNQNTTGYSNTMPTNTSPAFNQSSLVSNPNSWANINWGDFGYSGNVPGALRSTEWGGHVVYVPGYGWQDAPTVATAMNSGGLSGLTPQLGNDWRQYYGDRRVWTDAEKRAMQQGWNQQGDATAWLAQQQGGQQPNLNVMTNPAPATTTQTGVSPYTGDIYNSQLGGGGVQYPGQWNTASDIYNLFAQGMPGQVTPEWEQASQTATQMAQTGAPVNIDPYYQARLAETRDLIKNSSDEAAEQYGLGGLRQSSSLGQQLGNISSQAMRGFGADIAEKELSSLENARQRQLSGVSALTGLGAGISGLEGDAMNRALQAASGLAGMGSLVTQYPMDLAQQAMNMGLQLQGAQQSAVSPMISQYMYTNPENSNWLNYAMQGSNMQNQMTPEMYQPSGASQALDTGTGIAGILAMLKYAGLLSSVEYKTDIEEIDAITEESMADKILDTAIFKYRYKEESPDKRHIGLILEESPDEVGFFGRFVGLYEYIGTLHATIKSLNRRLEAVENRGAL